MFVVLAAAFLEFAILIGALEYADVFPGRRKLQEEDWKKLPANRFVTIDLIFRKCNVSVKEVRSLAWIGVRVPESWGSRFMAWCVVHTSEGTGCSSSNLHMDPQEKGLVKQ